MDSNYFNPLPCNNGALASLAALASTVNNITSPFPLFYTSSKCGGGVNGASFPQYFLPINCTNDIIPPASANCLRVISPEQFNDGKSILSPTQINYLPTSTQHSNMFSDTSSRLYSWYVPPNYTLIFYQFDPSKSIPNTIPRLEQRGDYLQVDACLGVPYLNDGVTPFWDPVPGSDYCQLGGSPFFQHTAPFVVVIENQSFNSLILSMCLDNQMVQFGTNSLNNVWYPQSPGCDSFITNYCSTPNDNEICQCFKQQQQLEKLYPNINISVCSFGSMVSGSMETSCAFNTKAYKTEAMLKNCVSFAQCMSNTDNALIQCMGEFVTLPKNANVQPTVTPAQYEYEDEIPFFGYIMLILAGCLLLFCLAILAFL